jgi:hypothetical protein
MKPCKCGNEELEQFVTSRDPLVVTILCEKCGMWTGNQYSSFVAAWAAWDLLMGVMGVEEAVRKPISGFSAQNPNNPEQFDICVVCSDGTVWIWIGEWQQLPPVPGTEADR